MWENSKVPGEVMSVPKVTIVGAGQVGSTTALMLAVRGRADVVLIDIDGDVARGKALDISQALSLTSSPSTVTGGDDYALAEGTDVAVITAGSPRRPGMSREDLLNRNAEVVREAVLSLAERAGECVIVVVTNPLDVMAYLAWRVTGWKRNRIMGMAGLLDGSRYAYFLSRELGVPPGRIHPMVLGSHGDAMLPLPRFTYLDGKRVSELLPPEALRDAAERTREGGAEIVRLLKAGSAYFAPSACVARMVSAVLEDEGCRVPASVLLRGEYGLDGVFLGVPVTLGREGWREIVELPLHPEERSELEACADSLRKSLEKIDGWLEGQR